MLDSIHASSHADFSSRLALNPRQLNGIKIGPQYSAGGLAAQKDTVDLSKPSQQRQKESEDGGGCC